MAGRFDTNTEILYEIQKANGIRESVSRRAPWLPDREAA
jgi:hypothetical protein